MLLKKRNKYFAGFGKIENNPMKIMILVPAFSQGSPIVGAFLCAKYFKENNLDVVFVSLDRTYRMKKNILEKIRDSGIEHTCLDINGWWGLLRHRRRLQNYCSENNINVVIAYLLRPTLIVSSLSEVIKIAYVRGMLNNDYVSTYGRHIAKMLISIEMKALKKMNHVFSMTAPMTEWLISAGIDPSKVSIIKNFIDVKSVKSSLLPDKQRNGKEIRIGMFCKYVKRKRIDVAIMAIGKLIHDYRYHNVKLYLAGFGPLRSKMEKMAHRININNNVIFHGFLTESLELMAQMDMVLLTSESEGVPRCLMEALSMGKTVIASDVQGVNELIMDKETGYLFPVGDVDQLASTIDYIIKRNAYLSSEQLVNFMMNHYDINAVCENMLNQIGIISGKKNYPELLLTTKNIN